MEATGSLTTCALDGAGAHEWIPDGPIQVGRKRFIGDSITVGWHATSEAETWPNLLVNGLNLPREANVSKVAVAGYMAKHVLTKELPENQDLVVIAIGNNDASKATVDDFDRDYHAMISEIRDASPDAALICTTPFTRDPKARPYARVIETHARAQMAKVTNWTTVGAQMKYRATIGDDFWGGEARDAGHPNSAGHEALAKSILNWIVINR